MPDTDSNKKGTVPYLSSSVADPDPYVLGLPDPDPLVRCTDSDPSIIQQKE